jgi:magnesium transporter
VGLFEGTIARFTALAVLMPVVAGEAGNNGQQALAVTLRGLALREVRARQWVRITDQGSASVLQRVAVALTAAVGRAACGAARRAWRA